MKNNILKKKLNLNKETISQLSKKEMNQGKGGAATSNLTVTCYRPCVWTNLCSANLGNCDPGYYSVEPDCPYN